MPFVANPAQTTNPNIDTEEIPTEENEPDTGEIPTEENGPDYGEIPTEYSIVYTRQPRATTPAPDGYADLANWQHASDVGRINSDIAEADLVLDDQKGNVEVIYDCTTSSEICVAHEARVSPDGSKIIFSVGRAAALTRFDMRFELVEMQDLTSAELWIYDVATKTKTLIEALPGTFDRQPEWLSNTKIVFSSNRAHTYPHKTSGSMHQDPTRCWNPGYCAYQEYGYGISGQSMHLWTMNIDGTDAKNITPHDQMALSPAVMSNGDILYSCWQAYANKAYDNPSGFGTTKNKWWLCRTDGNGADVTVILNAHNHGTFKTGALLPGGHTLSKMRAMRSVAEIHPGKIAVTNYYRENHVGSMGVILGLDYDNPHVEGCSTSECYPDAYSSSPIPGTGGYMPRTLKAITPYGQDGDNIVALDAQGRPMGKAGYAAPLPGDGPDILITHGRGSCYEVTTPAQTQQEFLKGELTCQKGIYRVKVPMVTDPFDTSQMEMVAGGPEWHAFDARAVVPYRTMFGIAAPAMPDPLPETNECFLQVVNARDAELAPLEPYSWMTSLFRQCGEQGCAVNTEDPDFYAQEVAALKVLLPEMWNRTLYPDDGEFVARRNNMGHKSIATLGTQPLMSDGSVKMQVPCDTPLILQGVDANGLAVAHDDMVTSLRPGETRTCHGCHFGHSEEVGTKLSPVLERFATTEAAAINPKLPTPTPAITYDQIKPIIDSRCISCHTNLKHEWQYSRIVWDDSGVDWPDMPRKVGSANNGNMSRPYTSKYIAKFARDSLFYWKCIGSRQDGRTDDQYSDDINFGVAHVSGATVAECNLIGRWIDSGVQY